MGPIKTLGPLVLAVALARAAEGASAVSFVIDPVTPSDADGATTTQVSVVLADGESPEQMDAYLRDTVNGTLSESPGARVEVLCMAGSGTDLCARAEGVVAAAEGGAVTFDSVPVPAEKPDGDTPEPGPPSDWRETLSVIRFLVGGVTVGATIAVTKGNPYAVFTLGVAAALWGWHWQRKNRSLLDWQASDHLLKIRTEQRGGLGLRLAKRSLYTGLYAFIMSAGFAAHGLNPEAFVSWETAGRMAVMIAQSLFLQSAWQAVNHELRERAIARQPAKEWYYQRMSGLASLAQSMVAVAQNILNVGGAKMGPWLAATLAASGLGPQLVETLSGWGAGTWSAVIVGGTGWLTWALVERKALIGKARELLLSAPVVCRETLAMMTREPSILFSVTNRVLGGH